ncbi:MAG: FtsX-like permease family protein, partial [Acetanaerobacterium sp.]
SARAQLSSAKTQLAAGRAQYEQGLAAYSEGVQTRDTLSGAIAAVQNPDATAEERTTALAAITGIAAALNERPDTQPLAQALDAFAADPENSITIYTVTAAMAGFSDSLAESRDTLDAAKKEIDAGQAKISAGYSALASAQSQLEDAHRQLEDAQTTLEEKSQELADATADGQKELDEAAATLADGEREFADGEAEYASAKADAEHEIADAQAKIDDGQREIDDLEPPEWYILSRDSFPANAGYYDDAQRIDAISRVFPVFFFLVAALVCLTTMTRMVEEKRTELGTIKALGYGKGAAVFKFLFYAALASLFGSIFGLVIGFKVFPWVIGSAYGILYHIPPIQTPFHWDYAVATTLVAVLGTALAALLACYKELAEQPAALMRPKAPKPGKRVLLERVSFVWNRLSFIQKVTIRNLVRYKRRILMTVIGIAGCTALMLSGFGLKNSISAIASKQYGEIFLYNGMVLLDENAAQADKDALSATTSAQDNITDSLYARQETLTALSETGREFDAALFVPKESDNISDYAMLRTRVGHEPIELAENGAVVTEKLASLLDVGIGDTITLRDADNRPHTIEVSGITENYAFHYIYLSRHQYEETFGQPFVPNTLFMRLGDTSNEVQDALSQTLLGNGYVLGITYNSSVEKSFNDILQSLDYVVLVLIFSAGLLAFVVLYNLTNINVTERIREIATIKVLGFYDREVSSYIYRENILLTLAGIAFGLFGGVFLHHFVTTQAEVDAVMFGRGIGWFSYLMAALLTLAFSLLVNFVLHFRLKRVSMVESLKSVE